VFRQPKPESRSAERELASAFCAHLCPERVPFMPDTRERPQYLGNRNSLADSWRFPFV
jgi:hypothetical protein